MEKKATTRKREQKQNNSIFKSTDNVLNELGTQQFTQTFTAALAIHTYALKDQRVHQLFRLTFQKLLRSTQYLNAGSFIQGILKKTVKSKPTILQVILWLHSVNIVADAIDQKDLRLRVSYRVGNVLGVVVQCMTEAWSTLFNLAGHNDISSALFPYMYMDMKQGQFRHLAVEDGFAPLAQRRTFEDLPEPSTTGPGLDATAVGRSEAMDKAYRQLCYGFLKKLHSIITDKTILLTEKAEDVKHKPAVHSLVRKHGEQLPYVFVELDDTTMETLGIAKPVPSPIEVINVESSGTKQVGIMPQVLSSSKDRSVAYKATPTHTSGGGPSKKRKLNDGGSVPGSGRRRVVRRNDSVDNVTGQMGEVVVKDEDVLDVVPALSDELTADAKNAFEVLKTEMDMYVSFYTTDFKNLSQTHGDVNGMDIDGSVDLVLTDPPYNIRREAGRRHSSYDVLTDKGMSDFSEVVDDVLCPGGHAVIFCDFLQFGKWHGYFAQWEDESDDEAPDDGDIPKEVSRQIFQIEQAPLQFVRRQGNYNSNPIAKKVTHTNMVDIAIHLWKTGLTTAQMLEKVDYCASSYVPSTLPGWTNTIDNIGKPLADELVYMDEVGENGKPLLLRPEQKPLALMQTLVSKYSPPNGLVFDPFAGTLSTAKACLLLPEHRRCVCGDLDPKCAQIGMVQLVEVFAKQVLNEKSDIDGSADVQAAASTFLHGLQSLRARKFKSAWPVPPGFHAVQTLPAHILHFLSGFYSDRSLYASCQNVPYLDWSPAWRSRLEGIGTDMLLAHELTISGMEIRKSTIPGAGKGLFTSASVSKGQVIGHYYGTLLYDSKSSGAPSVSSGSRYGEGIFQVDMKNFSAWAMETKWKARDKESNGGAGTNYRVYVFPAPFCAMRFINDARRTPLEIENNVTVTRRNNVEFRDSTKPSSVGAFTKFNLIELVALENIPSRRELFADYGNSYQHWT
jgi:DNA modification methylase